MTALFKKSKAAHEIDGIEAGMAFADLATGCAGCLGLFFEHSLRAQGSPAANKRPVAEESVTGKWI